MPLFAAIKPGSISQFLLEFSFEWTIGKITRLPIELLIEISSSGTKGIFPKDIAKFGEIDLTPHIDHLVIQA